MDEYESFSEQIFKICVDPISAVFEAKNRPHISIHMDGLVDLVKDFDAPHVNRLLKNLLNKYDEMTQNQVTVKTFSNSNS